MPPVFQVDPNSDRITTVGAVGLCSSRLVLVQKHCLPALNTPVQVAIPAHVHINASILARILSLCSRFIVAHGVNYETTSTNVIPISNRACMSIAVVTSVVLLCLPVGLFLALFMRRRSTGNRGRSNNGLRRTYSPVYPVLSSRRTTESPPLPPCFINIPSSYSESTILQEISAINMNPDFVLQMENQTNDQLNMAVIATHTDFVDTASSNLSSDPWEMHIPPPTPLIPTIQLPLVEDEMEIADIALDITTSPFFMRCHLPDVDTDEAQFQVEERAASNLGSAALSNLSDLVSGVDGHLRQSPGSTPRPEGSLGLIFRGKNVHTSECAES